MIAHIQGKLVERNPTDVIIDCQGVGYLLNISLHTFSQIGDSEHLKLYTHLQIKEDAHTLFGFSTVAEREIFRLLISVNGVGASTARIMLSSLTPKQIRDAIAHEDFALIQSIKGIGAKTAQRITIELKDKILKIYDIDDINKPQSNTIKDEALSALEVLGYNKKQVEKVVNQIIKQSPQDTVENIIKQALKTL